MKMRIISAVLSMLILFSVTTAGASAETAADPEVIPTEPAASAAASDTPTDEVDSAEPETIPATAAVDLVVTGDDPTDAPTEPVTEAPTEAPQPVIDYPQITGVSATANGATVKWSAYNGAAKYRIYLNDTTDGWKMIGTSTTTSFEHKNLTGGKVYLYTVRAIGANGKFIGGFDHAGYSYRYIATPALISVTNVVGGQTVAWKASKGAGSYRVYAKTTGSWFVAGTTTGTSFRYTKAKSGTRYTYTVRAIDANKASNISYYSKKGISLVFIAAPNLKTFKSINGGTALGWNKVPGAYRYGVFIKASGKWKRICVTDKTTYNHLNLKANTLYTYTVRCIDKQGKYCSGYGVAGKSFRYLAPPVISSIASKVVKWNSNAYAAGYRVFRKQYGKSWIVLGDTNAASFTDNTAAKDVPYTYTVRCLNASGNLISYFTNNGKYYINGNLANGTYTVGGKTLMFSNGVLKMKGYVTVDGKMYYYNAKGVLQKNGLVGSYEEGYRYADKNGVIDLKYTGVAKRGNNLWYLRNGKLDYSLRTAVTVGGVDYNVLGGKAYKVTSTKDKTLHRALKIVTKVTKSSMTKSQKLKAVWNHLRTAYGENNPRSPEYYGSDWPEVYANDIFVGGTGNCFSYAAAFAYLAKAVGYSKCYACNSGGHGWSEVEGLVYDAEWSMHSSKYTYYAMSYDDPCDVPYKAALTVGSTWAHVAI